MTLKNALVSAAGNAADRLYVEDVFSTYLYTGNGGSQTITNGIDLAGEGGLVWIKNRTTSSTNNLLFDTERGSSYALLSDSTGAQVNLGTTLQFNGNGFSVNVGSANSNQSSNNYASWTFRKAPKFFDVVTYTGDGTLNRQITHSLGATPGFIIVKSLSDADNWYCWHRSLTGSRPGIRLDLTNAASSNASWFGIPANQTSAYFTTGDNAGYINATGATYVAYLFAHNAGGFGEDGTENVISCGSFTTDGSGQASVNLGYEPQWLLMKDYGNADNWLLVDNMRGMPVGAANSRLFPNLSDAEGTGSTQSSPTATGFNISWNASRTYIYIAIRRGPMKTPTSGTEVFYPQILANGNDIDGTTYSHSAGFAPDWMITKCKGGSATEGPSALTRLTGLNYLRPNLTNAEAAASAPNYWALPDNKNYYVGADNRLNGPSTYSYIYWLFRRAPGFFDVVCYTGTGVDPTSFNHNLGVVPEMIIIKNRSNTSQWFVYQENLADNTKAMVLSLNNAVGTVSIFGTPTSSVFVLTDNYYTNTSTENYIAYLFASCPGVSKVGSYTGTGTTNQIDCGFSSGARFVLIKRTDSTGDWYVYDTARGIVAGNDPYLLINSTAAEVTSTDYVDTYSAGFELSSTAPAALNANGGSYIYLAIA